MTVSEVQNEIKKMSSDEQDHLVGFLAALRKFRDAEYKKEIEKRKKDREEFLGTGKIYLTTTDK